MKISLKLPLTFAVTIFLLISAALFGIYQLNQSINLYQTEVKQDTDYGRQVLETTVLFKTQVQEWKNVLLRGKDPAQLDKYWASFVKHEKDIDTHARAILVTMHQPEMRKLMETFIEQHATMGANYRKGLDAFKAAQFDATAGDKAVAGMDRAPTQLLEQLGKKILVHADASNDEAARAGRRAGIISTVLMLLVGVVSVFMSIWVTRSVVQPIQDAVAVAQSVASGDLSTPIQSKGQDETGQLLTALHEMQEKLIELIYRVQRDADGLSTAAVQIDSGNSDLSKRTEGQAVSLEQTAASMDELGATVRQNAGNANQANQLAQNAATVAVRGGDVVGQVVDTMKGINDSSRKIADIISVIDGIAFQTNILALNAAVEAARAGEQGRGFAVVATEVRSLAGRSAAAAKEIKELITDSVARVEQGTGLVDQAVATMEEVVSAIQQVVTIVAEISSASAEQAHGVEQVGVAVTQMDQSTQQNAAMVEEMAAAAASLRSQANELVEAVSVFILGSGRAHQIGAPRSA
jgi:methyl-accepting chemotaxis protein-1 (serine sensor receptor)